MYIKFLCNENKVFCTQKESKKKQRGYKPGINLVINKWAGENRFEISLRKSSYIFLPSELY